MVSDYRVMEAKTGVMADGIGKIRREKKVRRAKGEIPLARANPLSSEKPPCTLR